MHGRFSSGRFSKADQKLISDINVTPFVDVMLVLLIIFMVTAPLLQVGVPVDLPKSKAQNIADPIEPIVLSITKKGTIFIQETKVEEKNLIKRLEHITKNNKDAQIFLRGDRGIDYGKVMTIMGLVNGAGFTKLSLIAESAD